MTAPSPRPRRIATPRWLDLRLVLGVLLVLAAVLVGATVVSRAGRTHPVLAATHDLSAGTVLHAADLTTADVQLPGNGTGIYLTDRGAAVGRTLDRPVTKGELLPAAAIHPATSGTTLTVPLAAGAAPSLRAGERIEMWLSTTTCASVVLLSDVAVQEVHDGSDGSFGSGSDGQDVTISVQPAQAGRVIAALGIDQAQIRAGVLSTGDPVPAAASPTPGQTVPASGRLPADLAACASPSAGR